MMKVNFFAALVATCIDAASLNQSEAFNYFAQLSDSKMPTCATTSERARTPTKYFYEMQTGKHKFEDSAFPHGSQALFWANMGEADGAMRAIEKTKGIEWNRASEKFPKATLFGEEGVKIEEMDEAWIGNNWLVAAVSHIAEKPGRIEKLFLNNKNAQSPSGIYGVNIYVLGFPMTVMVDEYLPLIAGEDDSSTTIFSKVKDNGALWAPILEKAFAKRYGNYEHIEKGLPSEAVRALTGAPYKEYLHKNMNVEELWQLVSTKDKFDDFITVGTENADDAEDGVGADKGYSYSVIDTHTLKKDNTRLIKIRNPWGNEGFRGTMTDKDPRWSDEVKKELGYTNGNDGAFWIDVNNYKMHFSETWISMKVEEWSAAKFLKINDESQEDNPGTWAGVCGTSCTRHTFTLTSDVEQTVHVTPFTWGDRGIPEECENQDNALYHAILVSKLGDVTAWSYGDKPLESFVIKPKETIFIETEWNFTNDAHAKDWSITCYGNGEKGSLHLVHDKNLSSDSWNPTPRQEPKLPKVIPAPDKDSEAAFKKWVNEVPIEGVECSMLKEDKVDMDDDTYFFRTAIKSECDDPVSYLVGMYADDWVMNMEHAHPNMNIQACIASDATDNVIECMITMTPKLPVTGWQLKQTSYGIHSARKCDKECIEEHLQIYELQQMQVQSKKA